MIYITSYFNVIIVIIYFADNTTRLSSISGLKGGNKGSDVKWRDGFSKGMKLQ